MLINTTLSDIDTKKECLIMYEQQAKIESLLNTHKLCVALTYHLDATACLGDIQDDVNNYIKSDLSELARLAKTNPWKTIFTYDECSWPTYLMGNKVETGLVQRMLYDDLINLNHLCSHLDTLGAFSTKMKEEYKKNHCSKSGAHERYEHKIDSLVELIKSAHFVLKTKSAQQKNQHPCDQAQESMPKTHRV
jgi:hypothetical protein